MSSLTVRVDWKVVLPHREFLEVSVDPTLVELDSPIRSCVKTDTEGSR